MLTPIEVEGEEWPAIQDNSLPYSLKSIEHGFADIKV